MTGFYHHTPPPRCRSDVPVRPVLPSPSPVPGASGLLLPAVVLLLVLPCLAALPASAQRVQARLSQDSVTVGDRFYLTIIAEHDGPVEPVFPAVSDSALYGDLEVIGRQARGGGTAGGVRVDSVVYEVTTFALDTAFVPPIPVRFTANEDTFSVTSQPLQAHVVSLVPPEAQGVRDLAPLVEFPAPLWPWILLVAGVLLVAGLLAYRAWRKRQVPATASGPIAPARVRTPYEEAVERLERLKESDPADPETIKPYYVELSDLLRHYLARRTGINAMESTTRELVRALDTRSALARDDVRRIRALLELADLVKFADARPPADRSRAAVDETREVVEHVERTLYRPPVDTEPEAAPPGEPPLVQREP